MGEDYSKELYGDLTVEPIFPTEKRVWTEFKEINESLVDKEILVRGRLFNSRVKGNLAFLVMRNSFLTV